MSVDSRREPGRRSGRRHAVVRKSQARRTGRPRIARSRGAPARSWFQRRLGTAHNARYTPAPPRRGPHRRQPGIRLRASLAEICAQAYATGRRSHRANTLHLRRMWVLQANPSQGRHDPPPKKLRPSRIREGPSPPSPPQTILSRCGARPLRSPILAALGGCRPSPARRAGPTFCAAFGWRAAATSARSRSPGSDTAGRQWPILTRTRWI